MAEAKFYFLFVRDGCLAMVPREGEGFAAIGSTGLMTDDGLLYLVWRDDKPYLTYKEFETAATPEQLEKVQRFSADLKAALGVE